MTPAFYVLSEISFSDHQFPEENIDLKNRNSSQLLIGVIDSALTQLKSKVVDKKTRLNVSLSLKSPNDLSKTTEKTRKISTESFKSLGNTSPCTTDKVRRTSTISLDSGVSSFDSSESSPEGSLSG